MKPVILIFASLTIFLFSTFHSDPARQSPSDNETSKPAKMEEEGVRPPEDLMAHYYHPQSREEVAEERYQYIKQYGSFRMLGDAYPYRSSMAGSWGNIGPGGSQNKCPNINPRYTYAGRIISFAQDHDDRDLMFAGGASGGLWKSTDGGSSWEVIMDDLPHPSVSTIEVNVGDPGEIWFGTGDRGNGSTGSAAPSLGMAYKSEDEGVNWTAINFTSNNIKWVSKIMVRPKANTNDDDIIFIATNAGLYRGTDNGGWQLVTDVGNRKIADVELIGSLLSPDFKVVAAEDDGDGIWYSDDKGLPGTWKEVDLPGIGNFGRVSLTSSVTGLHNKVYANVGMGNGSWAGVWRSDDGGASWTKTTHPKGGNGGQMNYNNTIMVENNDGDRVYTGTNTRELLISNDGGNSWYKSTDNSNLGNLHEDQQYILQDVTADPTLYVANDGGLYKSTDRGQTFDGMGNDHLPVGQIYHLTISPLNPGTYYIGTQDVGLMRGPDQFGQWQQLTCCDGGDITFKDSLHYSTITGLNASNNNRYQYPPTKDVCQPWTGFANGLPPGSPWTSDLVWSGKNFYTNFPGTVLYSTSSETTPWSAVRDFKDRVQELDAQEDGADETVIVGVDKTNPVRVSNRYNSTFHKPDETDAFWENKRVTDIEIIKENAYGHEVVMGLSGTNGIRVVKSYNSGNNWTDLTGDLPNMVNVRSITADPDNTDFMYIGTDFGVYVTPNGGINWYKYDQGLPSVSYINDIHYDNNLNEVVAGTYGRGVFVSEPADPSVGVHNKQQDIEIELFPNPAKSHVNVAWGPQVQKVSLIIESLDGKRLIETVASGKKARLNIMSLNTGTYLLRIRSKQGEIFKRFVKLY